MKDFAGKIAVITGGGTGMGRELARQLVAEGCNVAMCDVSAAAMAETKRLCEVEKLPQGLRITTHIADVSIEDQLLRFRDELAEQQGTDRIHLLFNNAGIGGGGSLFTNTREQWEKTFNICWGGVYLGVRTFLPLLLKADEGHIVNTSSVNGFWASVGPGVSHTAYSAAKFAVKGFTEALINDLRLNAPHIKCSVVMPGHIGTSIVSNSRKIQSGSESERLSETEIAVTRQRLNGIGIDTAPMSDEDIQQIAADRARTFRDELTEQQATDKIHLLFNNAGIGGGGSLFTNTREQWEKTFNICWGGVYLGVRTFLPMLVKADEAHIVNTSSVNGFWASVGIGVSHTAYSAAKFAVKGFTEALINDLRLNAPHVKCSVVMPGHIGTSIVSNSRKIQSGSDSDRLSENEVLTTRQRLKGMGIDTAPMSDEDIQKIALDRARTFRDEAPTTAATAARTILDGVKADRWRILVGDDAHRLDERVRQAPERAYEPEFYQSFAAEVGWRLG